jgi:hypothetical protein
MDDPSGKCDVDPSQTVAPRIIEKFAAGTGANGVTVTGLAGDGTTSASAVSFNGYGQALKAGSPLATIDIAHSQGGARRLEVKITSGGGIRMCDRDVTVPDPRSCG